MVISGASGPNAAAVNGRYQQVAGFDRNVYRKLDDAEKWLFVAADDTWFVGSAANKDESATTGWAHSVAPAEGLPPPRGAGLWQVVHGDGQRWAEQTLELEQTRPIQALQAFQAAQLARVWQASQVLVISGAMGESADLANGRYEQDSGGAASERYRKVSDSRMSLSASGHSARAWCARSCAAGCPLRPARAAGCCGTAPRPRSASRR